MSTTTEALIDAVTREVLAALAGKDLCDCSDPDCRGACAAHCADKVRSVVSTGAGRISFSGNGADVPRDLARFIDHTLLKPDATADDIDALCDEARTFGFAAVCVNPTWVRRCAQLLRGSDVKVASVVGFPFGASTTEVKALEARRAIRDGAREIDMVINVGALKSGDDCLVEHDIRSVAQVAHEYDVICKVIIETALLTDDEKVRACLAAKKAGADFVKTSTGFSKGGATVADVALMRRTVGSELGVKASGGVKGLEDARKMVEAGATRIGASVGVKIAQEAAGGGVSAVRSSSY